MISQSRYISIISGVGAGASVANRSLAMRIITQNTLLYPGIVAQFANASAVSSFFGATSEEYLRAVAYFGFVSKQINSPNTLSFSRWVNAAIGASVVGDTTSATLAKVNAVTAGTLTINSNTNVVHVTAINMSAAANLTAAAAILQTALRATSDPLLTACTVTYNTTTNQFVLTAGTTGTGTLSVVLGGSPPLGTDCAAAIGWGTTGAVNVPGQGASTAVQAAQASAGVSNNFGSFVFTSASNLATADITAVATWNDSQNNQYMYSVPVTAANASTVSAAVIGLSGCALSLLSSSQPNDFIEQSPCEIMAATNYNSPVGVQTQNFMYYQFPNRNVTVTDDPTANAMDALRVNYIGLTQENGQTLAFYQRGILCGNSADAVDMNTYANEIWLKSTIAAALFAYFLAVGRVPANEVGQAAIFGIMTPVITQAKGNGVVSAGKTLTAQQQLYITQQSGSATAWRQVQTIGYWLSVVFTSAVNPNTQLTEWTANYVLIYSKDDAVRQVVGQDIMI